MNVQPNLGMQVTTFDNPMGIDGFARSRRPGRRARAPHAVGWLSARRSAQRGMVAIARARQRVGARHFAASWSLSRRADPDRRAFAADFADFATRTATVACGCALRFVARGAPTA
ncbi:MAG: hypothetical protein WDW38_006468 [Sanguina aurantia]